MTIKERPKSLGPQRRSFALRTEGDVDLKARTLRISFASDEPVPMWYGDEILDHSKGAMRMGERQQNLPLLFNHDLDDLLGRIDDIEVKSGRSYATVRFGKDERGEWAMQQAADGILVNASCLYRVFEYLENFDEETLTATDYEIYEISLVTVPADASVGVGRSAADLPENIVSFKPRGDAPTHRSFSSMPDPVVAPAGANNGGAAPAAAAAPAVDIELIRRQGAEQERQRMSDISQLATRFSLGNEFIERHRIANSSPEVAQRAALEALESQQRDRSGIEERERTRMSEIDALCARFQMPEDFKRKHMTDKTSIENVRGLVLEYVGQRGGPAKPLSNPSDGIPAADLANFSIRKAILACITNDWKEAGFEREVSSTLQKTRKHSMQGSTSFLMPTNMPFQVSGAQRSRFLPGGGDMQSRAVYQVGTAAQGGNVVGTELLAADFIEVLRNRTVTGQLGARYLTGLVENINIPRQNSQTQTYWVGESTAHTEAEATFDQVQLRPHVVGALSKMSRLMLQQATPAIEQIVREDLLMVEALAVDAAALYGTGSSSQPTGISNTTNVGSVVGGTNGANWTFDQMVELYAAPLVANAPQENLAFAINAKTKGYLATLKSTTGQYLWNPTQSIAGGIPSDLVGYRYAVSNQLPYNLTKGSASAICSMAIFGNWQELLIGEWGVTEVMVNPYDSTGFTSGDVIVRVFQTIDVGLRHPQSFSVQSDGLTPGF